MNRTGNRRATCLGSTLVEITVASFLTIVLATTLEQGLLALHAQRAEAGRRRVARCETANELQRLAALDWNELAPAPVHQVALSKAATRELPNGRLTSQIETPADDPGSRRIHVELQWLGPSSGQPEEPIRLTAWVHERARRPSQ
jgi:hypothetical protein